MLGNKNSDNDNPEHFKFVSEAKVQIVKGKVTDEALEILDEKKEESNEE